MDWKWTWKIKKTENGSWKQNLVGVVSTHLKNISQNGNLPQVGVEIKDI